MGDLIKRAVSSNDRVVWFSPSDYDFLIVGSFSHDELAVAIDVLYEPGKEYVRVLTTSGVVGWVPLFSIARL